MERIKDFEDDQQVPETLELYYGTKNDYLRDKFRDPEKTLSNVDAPKESVQSELIVSESENDQEEQPFHGTWPNS